jgi:uncharacterized membrane protein (DUF373 family)
VLLSVAAALAFAGAAKIAWNAIVQWPQIRSLFEVVDRLLLVLMIIELLHTVRSSIQSHQLGWEPFLIVAMIADVRRILVITLEISDQTPRVQASGSLGLSFDQAMVELGVGSSGTDTGNSDCDLSVEAGKSLGIEHAT